MRNPVLYFFLLVLEVLFNPTPDIIYERSRFSKTFLEKILQFVLCGQSGPITLNLGFMLLLAGIDPILEEQDYEKDVFVTLGFNGFEIVLELSTEVIAFYVRIFKV